MREERKVVTALFADLVGSTTLAERLDPEDVREIVGGAIARMVTAVEDLGGIVKDLAGDGVLALFGAPDAHEDDPERAVRAGLRIVEDLADHGDEVAEISEVQRLGVRVGIESGVVVLGPIGAGTRIEYGATGDALNTAARLQAAAEPGSVLVGGATQRLILDRFEWGPPLELVLKGKTEPVLAYRAVGPRDAPDGRRLESTVPLVGRDEELRRAGVAVADVAAGTGRVVFVIGEPGIGKTRLLAETRSLVEGGGGTWLEGRCSSLGSGTPYLPFRDLILRWLGLEASGRPRTTEVLAERIDVAVGERADDVRPYLTRLIGAPPHERDAGVLPALSSEALRYRTLEALAHLVRALARRRPIALAIEDLHWADESSVGAASRLLPLVETSPVLFVLSSRHEPDHPSSALLGGAPAGRCDVLRLDTLPRGADRELLEALVGPGVLPEPLLQRLLEAAGGNPFHLEELVRSIADAGALVPVNGHWRYHHDVPVDVPATLDRVLLARIDRLAAGPRAVLTAASVLGRRFDARLLAEILGAEQPVDLAVADLVRSDLVRPTDRGAFAFKHALVQEVAYSTLLRRQRRELHGRAAAEIERMAGNADDAAPTLAYHYRAAGNLEDALAAHRRASRAALRLSSLQEAARHLDEALTLATELDTPGSDPGVAEDRALRGRTRARTGDFDGAVEDLREVVGLGSAPAIDDIRLEALLELGAVVAGAANYHDAERILEDVRAQTEARGDRRRLAVALARRSIVRTNLLQLDGAAADAERALELARATGDEDSVAAALDAAELVGVMLGDFETVERVVEELAGIHRRRGDLWLLQHTLFQSSWEPLARCDWNRALERLDEAESVAIRIGDRGTIPMYGATRCWLARSRGRYAEGAETGAAAAALADELRHPEWRSWTRGQLGRLLLDAGALTHAERELREALSSGEDSGSTIQVLRAAALLAAVRLESADDEGALAWADRAAAVHRGVTAPSGSAYLQGADAPIAIASVLTRTGRPAEALEVAQGIERAAATAGWREYVALARLAMGDARDAAGDAPRASVEYRAALDAAGDDLPGSAWRAHARLARTEGSRDRERSARAIVDGLLRNVADASIREGLASALDRELDRGGRRP